jgi:hypothetical protein
VGRRRAQDHRPVRPHAEITVAAADRAALERLARYVLRPPVAQDAFPPMLMLYTFGCYYNKHPRILTHYGLEVQTPHPKGYEVAPTDLSLLDPVRKRGPIYRTC